MSGSSLVCFVLLALGVVAHTHSRLVLEEDVANHSLAGLSHRLRRSAESGIEIDWNQLIDTLLLLAQQQILADDKDEVTIPDVEEVFERKLGPLKIRGSFKASQGFVNSLSSLQRTGDFSLASEAGQSVTLTSHLGLAVLRVRYDRYRAELLGSSTTGDISASVSSNSVRSVIKFTVRDDGCSVTLEEVKVVDLGRFDVRISGLGPLDWLASRIATWATENKRGDIIARLEQAMAKQLRAAIAKFKCDEYYAMIQGELSKYL